MISFWAERDQRNCLTIKSPLAFIVNFFKKKKYKVRKNNVKGNRKCSLPPKVPTDLSVSVMDMRMSSPCPLSPALSTLTLTPGRMRDINQDMEALRLSRQDNPFLQVLASRESLVESTFESESDDTNLMSQEFPNELEVDPLSLPEIHEHMIRSPPPTTWPKSPNFKVFRFPVSDSEDSLQTNHSQGENPKNGVKASSSVSCREEEEGVSRSCKNNDLGDHYATCYSTVTSAHSFRTNVEIPHPKCNSGSRDSLSSIFPIFRATPMRSLSDVRRSNGNTEDQRTESLERRFDDETPPTLPLLSKSGHGNLFGLRDLVQRPATSGVPSWDPREKMNWPERLTDGSSRGRKHEIESFQTNRSHDKAEAFKRSRSDFPPARPPSKPSRLENEQRKRAFVNTTTTGKPKHSPREPTQSIATFNSACESQRVAVSVGNQIKRRTSTVQFILKSFNSKFSLDLSKLR